MCSAVLDFYVHIIESPSPANLLDGCTEGRMLCSFLELAQIPCMYNLAVDRTQFNESMTNRLSQGIQFFGRAPILHFSSHGGQEGIQLTNQREAGELIAWPELADLVRPINQYMGGGLGVCMSTCGGSHGRKMAEVVSSDQVPMGWIVGSAASVSFCDAGLAFAVFYRGLQRGVDLDSLVTTVRAASGVADFAVEFGQLIQEQYTQRMRDLLERLMRIGRTQPPQRENPTPPWLNPLSPFGLFGLPPRSRE